ncbi:MAG: class IV adenylate cyclase [Ferruginibacter sp.]
MSHINIEFKARIENLQTAEKKLLKLNPLFIGVDKQVDTYYHVKKGLLKLREGNIENALIYYEREDHAGSKQSNVILYPHTPSLSLKNILEATHRIKTIVKKTRRIYFIENVKFHFDSVENLGEFIEVEAIDKDGTISIDNLQKQCDKYIEFFNISPADFMESSYSILLIKKSSL